MGIREEALSKAKTWQSSKKNKSSSYDAPNSVGLDTSYSTNKKEAKYE